MCAKWKNHYRVLFFCTATAGIFAACGSQGVPGAQQAQLGIVTNYTTCLLPSDQGNGSIEGKWHGLPIPLELDRDFYAVNQGQEAAQIKLAVATWNAWAAVRGLNPAFTIQNDGSGLTAGAPIPVTTDCLQSTITNAVTNVVGVWKIQSGGNGVNTRPQGNGTCQLLATGIQGKTDWQINSATNIIGASVLLNFDAFNNSSANIIDLQSLALHELGHVLGLLHSCNPGNGDTTQAPSCAVAPEAYLVAVMFPFLNFSQLRRSLQQNDYNRVNCLY